MTYDMIVIGGGPAGYTAALYAARAGLKVVVLEKLSAGGQMALTTQIDNYPGFHDGIDGFQLGEQMQQQAERFGAETVLTEVTAVKLQGKQKEVVTTDGTFIGKTVVIATGADPRELGLPEEKALVGRGVNYCAACDGMRYRGKTVVVIGGGNTAVADALQLSRIAEKVILVHRRDSLRATQVYHAQLQRTPNIQIRWNSQVVQLLSDGKLTGVKLRDSQTGEESILPCDGVFVSIGRSPITGLVAGQLSLDEAGYIIAGESTQASVAGVFAVGDGRTKVLRQVVTAVSDGAMAAHYAEEYLASV
jgi:thioredoxin reductase (NADPH)